MTPLPHAVSWWSHTRGEAVVRAAELLLATAEHPTPQSAPAGSTIAYSGSKKRFRGTWVIAEWLTDEFLRLVRPEYQDHTPHIYGTPPTFESERSS